MADSPTNEFPRHGGEGKGPYGAGYPDNELATPNFRGRRLGEHNPDVYATNYPEHATATTHVNPPSDPEAIGISTHPFKLERYTRILTPEEREDGVGGEGEPETVRALRVHYGELWSTVSVIQTVATSVSGTNVYGISSQQPIPGINRTVIPDFVNEELDDVGNIRREVHRFVEFKEQVDASGAGDGGSYGIVLLTWHVNVAADDVDGTPVGAIKEAYIHKVDTTDDLPEDQLIQQLSIDGSNLRRAKDNVGIYSVVIGESRDMDETDEDENLVNAGKSPIDQQVYDHVYWSTCLFMGSDGAEDPDDPWTSTFTPGYYTSKKVEEAVVVEGAEGLLRRDRVVINGNRDLKGQAQDQ